MFGSREHMGELLGTHWHTVLQIDGGCVLGPEKSDPRHGGIELKGTSCPTNWIKNISTVTKMDPKRLSPHLLAFFASWDCAILRKRTLNNKPLSWESQFNLI